MSLTLSESGRLFHTEAAAQTNDCPRLLAEIEAQPADQDKSLFVLIGNSYTEELI